MDPAGILGDLMAERESLLPDAPETPHVGWSSAWQTEMDALGRRTMATEHQIWTTDEYGRDILVATTKIGSDAGVVFEAVKNARAFVEWRTAAHGQHRGRLFRGWDGEKREMYGPAESANLA